MESFRFPDDLVALQAAWLLTYDALAQAPTGSSTTMLRRRLLVLSRQLYIHPYWAAPGRSRTAWAELRRQARHRGWGTAA
ncbi:hypothetical protein ACIBEA_43560 [Streptomyces sp. NPDC051555]|uniref:hypothetical protein n=1 Tax=Streptomyces sp. NPDC051555 TaxID=3365657 RepID=UPI0037B30E1A